MLHSLRHVLWLQHSIGTQFKPEICSSFESSLHTFIRTPRTAVDHDKLTQRMGALTATRRGKGGFRVQSPSKCLDFMCDVPDCNCPHVEVKEGRLACGTFLLHHVSTSCSHAVHVLQQLLCPDAGALIHKLLCVSSSPLYVHIMLICR